MLENISKSLPVSITTQALLLGVTVGVLTYYTFFKKKYKLPPGPPALPLIGNLIDMNDSSEQIFQKLLNWRKKYGPIITIYFGPLRCVTLNDANVANEALVKKSAEYAGRFQTYSMSQFSSGFKNIVFADISPSWKQLRKIALQGLRQYLYASKLEEKVFESSMKMLDGIAVKSGQPVDFRKYISLLIFNLLYGVCFSKCYDIDNELFLRSLKILDDINTDIGVGMWEDVIPPLRKFPTSKFKRIISKVHRMIDLMSQEYKAHEEKFSEDNLEDFTDYLINARREAIKEDPEIESVITEAHLINTIADIFLAGIDTSRQTVNWCILLLVQHPKAMEKVQAEVDSVFGAREMPTVRHRERLPYTEAVLHESMRMCSVVPLGIPHRTMCDTTIGEYDVPKGTMVMVNQYALHHDPDWWKDPDEFRPERFLDEDGQLSPKTLSWLPFSAGRRNCLGETIARPEMHLILAILVRNLTIKCPEGKTLDLRSNNTFSYIPPINELIVTERN